MSQYEVPFFSQYSDIGNHEWRARGCGVAAVKMVMDFYTHEGTPSLEELLRTGLEHGAYREGIGWTHRGLVELARHYGYAAHNVDVAPTSPTPATPHEAFTLLLAELANGPVLASVWRQIDPQPSGGHIVVVTGWDGELIAFNDPIELSRSEGHKLLAREAFMRYFKQRFIVIRPK
jgi:hypothetical protein